MRNGIYEEHELPPSRESVMTSALARRAPQAPPAPSRQRQPWKPTPRSSDGPSQGTMLLGGVLVALALILFVQYGQHAEAQRQPVDMRWPTATAASAAALIPPTIAPQPTPTVDARYPLRTPRTLTAFGGKGTGLLGPIEEGRPYALLQEESIWSQIDVKDSGKVWTQTFNLQR